MIEHAMRKMQLIKFSLMIRDLLVVNVLQSYLITKLRTGVGQVSETLGINKLE